MKIKIAFADRDKNYLNKLVATFVNKYSDKLEVYSFTEISNLMEVIGEIKLDVILASDAFEIDFSKIPAKCAFAYFVDGIDIKTVNKQRAICKFQKIELMYKQILSIYSENAGNLSSAAINEGGTNIIVFSSPCGGVGTSIMAAACAVHYAMMGKKVIYLNFENYGSSDLYFASIGDADMSDLIFAIKSKKTNLSIKFESCVRQDKSGVFYYSPSKVALDMLEFSNEERMQLLSEINFSGTYDYIIVDSRFRLDKLDLFNMATRIVLVGDGSETSNTKISRAYTAVQFLEDKKDLNLTGKMRLIYNKFSNKTSRQLEIADLKFIGGSPRFEHATERQVLEELSKKQMFEELF
ncbi:MAG: chromosome partitioning protein ParA [Lachnospiraceae bacterium]